MRLDGLSATQAERVDWLQDQSQSSLYFGLDQSTAMAMMALTAVLLSTSWQIRRTNPLRALIAGLVICASCVIFFVPKFIAIWSYSATGASYRNRSAWRRYGRDAAFNSECFITLFALYRARLPRLLAVRALHFADRGPALRSTAIQSKSQRSPQFYLASPFTDCWPYC